VEETAEFQVGVDDTTRRRKLRLNKRKAIVAANVEAVSVHEELKCYCKCMQLMLQASAQPLIACLSKIHEVMQAYDDNKLFQQTMLHTAVMLREALIDYALPVIGTA